MTQPRTRYLTFLLEQFPALLEAARKAWPPGELAPDDPSSILQHGQEVRDRLRRWFGSLEASDLDEPTPFVDGAERLAAEWSRVDQALAGHFERDAVISSLSTDEKRWMLAGVILTRAVDNRMKQIFLSGELRHGEKAFQGKGFRSLGQEAIYAAALRLRRGAGYLVDGRWTGDVAAPLIRDLGVALAFSDDVAMPLNAQAGKSGPPLEGRDLHLGDIDRGVLPAAAPLSISTVTVTGMALGFKLRNESRVGLSFIGEGGSSLGEWHEAINLAAARRLPVVFCVQNNQTALSTRVDDQSAARTFDDKGLGYGVPFVTIDGTDPEAIAASWAWAAERARRGDGPTLIETVAMRMCGHAHHDDMLYLGEDPELGFDLPPVPERGYVDRDRYAAWAQRDPIRRYAVGLLEQGIVTVEEIERWKREAVERCDAAMVDIVERPWPDGAAAGRGVTADGPELTQQSRIYAADRSPSVVPEVAVEAAPSFEAKGRTYLEGVALGVGDALSGRDDTFVIGEDVAAPYGNAFLLLKPLLDRHADRILNAPLAESGIIGACVGAALAGMRPIGEMQFNDFVATGFNQLVNNAAKLRYRTGMAVPMVMRMPWGGLRRAGPYHSQDTAPWFYRTAGLKIVAPSTPYDARALMKSAVEDDDPVLYYEHIALYRDIGIKQELGDGPGDVPLGRAAFRRLGGDLSLVSYGAFVHRAMAVAERLSAEQSIECDVLDLRTLAPLDLDAVAATVRRTGRLLLVGEDSRTGSILESIASKVAEREFEWLDAPIRVLGALDAPVPYAPTLEDAFLVSPEQMFEAAVELAAW